MTLEEYQKELESWEGTPYRDNDYRKGIGVNCLGFVVAMTEWLHRHSPAHMSDIPQLPPQSSVHSSDGSTNIIRWLENKYNHKRVEKHQILQIGLEPGDIICVKNELYPGHVLIAGTRANEFWHAVNSNSLPNGGKVTTTNLAWCEHIGIVRAWHPLDICFN